MNKLIKISTILVVAISAIASFAPSFAFATSQASFSSSGMFLVGDHSQAGTQNWTTQLTNMQPGDQVAFKFTFLNTSSVTAVDAKSSFSATSNSNCIQVTGTIWAQNAPSVSQSVSICAPTGYTISLSQSNASFGGVGDVAPGYGGIEYYATGLYNITGQSVQQQPTANISASPNPVNNGGTSTINWSSTNASECHATSGAGFSTGGATSGSDLTSALYNTTTFSITCTNSSGGSANASVTVTVNAPVSQPTANIYANPSTINSGNSTLISWSSTNANNCQGSGFSTGGATSGSINSGSLYGDTVYSVTCTNSSGGSANASVTVRVNNTPPPPVQNPTANISVNPASVNSGNTTSIQWSSTNASECHATGGPGFSTGGATSGSAISSALTNTSTFSITCTNTSGGSASDSATVYVNSLPPVNPGSAPTAQTLSATGVSQNSATLNGSVNPNQANTSYWFEYGTSQSLGSATGYQSAGSGSSSMNVNSLVSGLIANTTYYFRVVAQNSYGTVQGSILSFTTSGGGGGSGTAPTVITGGAAGISQTSAQITGYVDPNGYSTSYWFEYGTSQSLGSATGFQSAGAGTDSLPYNSTLSSLSSNTTYYYRIVAQNTYGTSQGSILSFTTSNGGGGDNCIVPSVQTLSANNSYQSSAQLNGSVNPNNCQTSYWFEYGISYSLGNATGYQSAGSSNGSFNISSYISGLNYNQTYYFRAAAQNSAGTSYGSILSFTTSGGGGCISGNCGYGTQPYVQTLSATNYANSSITFNGSVNPNTTNYGDSVYGWFEYGTNINSLNLSTNSTYVGSGNYQQNFSQSTYNLMSGVTYYYRAAARNSYGTAYGQILSTNNGNYYGNGSAPQVITNAATYVSASSALLNGQVNANNSASTAWFEYGTTMNLGSQTTSQPVGMGSNYQNYSSALSGLSANTTYYFRADAQNSYGTTYGTILSFTTSGGGTIVVPQPPTTVVVRTVSTGNGLSCVVLVPSLNVSELTPGQNFTLTVTYRNGCNYNLSNVFLKVILPPGTDFVSTNYPFFNRDANGISYNLGALPVGFQSAISIEGTVGASVAQGNSMIFSAVVNFNDEQGKFQSVSAYLTAVVGSGQALSASVLQTFGNLLGNWIFDLILAFLIVFLIYWIFFKKQREERADEDVLEAKPIS